VTDNIDWVLPADFDKALACTCAPSCMAPQSPAWITPSTPHRYSHPCYLWT